MLLCRLHGDRTKACGWPLMANCILHSSFVNCCLPSSHFLLGHGTKPRTGGLEMAHQHRSHKVNLSLSPFSLSFHPFRSLSFSLSSHSRTSFYLLLTVCTSLTTSVFFPFFFLGLMSLLFESHFEMEAIEKNYTLKILSLPVFKVFKQLLFSGHLNLA